MVLGLLKNIPILNSFLGKPAASQESSETEAAAKANEKAIAQEGLKPLFIVALPEGDFSELKAKLKEKFNGRDLHFEVDPEIKKPKLYILKPNALAKRNLETALDKAFIKDNYRSIELSGDGNKLGESLLRTMNTEFITLEGAERKIEYTQKEAEKAKLRQSLESLSKLGVHIHDDSCLCGQDHGGGTGDGEISFSKTETRTADFSIDTERSKSLIDFFTALRESTETNHNEFIKKSNMVYIIHDPRKNSDEELDWQKCKLTIAQKAAINGLPNFNIYEMKLSDFLEGRALPRQSATMRIYQVHNESHVGFKAAPSLSILTHLTNLTKEHLNTAVQEQFQNDLNNTCIEIIEHIEETPSTKNLPSMKTFMSTSDSLVKENTFKDKIQSLLEMISSSENQENYKSLDWKIADKYRDARIKIASQPNIDKLLNTSVTDTESLLAQLEQSDPISQKINRELVKPLQKAMATYAKDTKKAAQNENDKGNHTEASKLTRLASTAAKDTGEVGGIALTGQFSFIDPERSLVDKDFDQGKFHKDNKTYKDFPELPESWKTEPKQTEPNTSQTAQNHEHTSLVSTAATDNSAKATETGANINNSSPASNESSPQIITETHEEKQTINQGVNNNEA